MASKTVTPTAQTFTFDNRFVNQLPADPATTNQPRQVSKAAYSRVLPTPVSNPNLVAWSPEVAEMLGISDEWVDSAEFRQTFSGNTQLNGMDPYAMCYGGHQFGNWAGQLGDGRAINLGELVNAKGEHYTLQLKGSGPTPYSRRADGRAVLRSSIREFLCSEAMYHLGVPTTRALSLMTTGDQVMRDMFYNGNAAYEKGAVVCRVAPSFTRFGNFQIFAARNEIAELKQLVDHTIRADFPHLGEPSKAVYAEWFREIVSRTADMIVHWMRVGFVHGVMNTDNMSILGQTIDYGPYGWLEDYDPNWTPNTTDAQHRRYRFGNQPRIAQWNLAQLASSLVPILEEVEPLQSAVDEYANQFSHRYQLMNANKIGLSTYKEDGDMELLAGLQDVLTLTETDMTIFYRRLADVPVTTAPAEQSETELLAPLQDAYYQPETITADMQAQTAAWLRTYNARILHAGVEDGARRAQMNAINPKYVLRNYIAQLAIDKADEGDNSLVTDLLDLLRNPYDEQPTMEQYAAKRPEWARHRAGCSMLSCSS